MTVFSNPTDLNGILEQTRDKARVDSTQWPTQRVVNSCNNWLDRILTYGKGKDRQFQLDDSNHTKLPIGSSDLIANQAMYSFLTDEQGNRITNITRIDICDASGKWTQLKKIDHKEITQALDAYQSTAGTPREYDLIADNVVKLYPAPVFNKRLVQEGVAGLKYYFQRTGSYFVATDTTKQPGVPNDLHEGFIVKSAYDCAVTLGLNNLEALSVDMLREEQKLEEYFASRNTDSKGRLTPRNESCR